jgi:exonuclease SbcC
MAAFLQKLFKSRKPTAPDRKTTPRAQPDAVPAEDKRADLRDEQLQALQAAPTQEVAAGLAIDGLTADIRLRAAEQLQGAELLQSVQKQAKGRHSGGADSPGSCFRNHCYTDQQCPRPGKKRRH